MNVNDYDGLCFINNEYGEIELSYFTIEKNNEREEGLVGNEIGNWYHIIFFKSDEDGVPILDETFDAILGDPTQYVKNFLGGDFFGCILRKTVKSHEWFDEWLKICLKNCQEAYRMSTQNKQ